MANYNIDAIYNGNTSLPGTLRVTIDASGNIGIATPSPVAPLDVQCNTGGTGIIIRGRSDNSTALRFYANNGTTQQAYIGTDDSNIDFLSVATRPIRFFVNSLIQYQINQLGVFSWYDGAGGTRMTLNSSGLGIGTTSPLERITFGSSDSIIARSSDTTFNSGYCSRILFNQGGTGYGYLGFYTYQGGTGGGERMRIAENGNVGINTSTPDKKLQVIGSLGKGYNLYEVSINLLQAIGVQAKRFEIARVFIDYNDWNLTGPVEIEVRENYYSDGRYKRYIFSYGYNSSNVGSLWLVEDAGRGANDFKAEAGAAVQVTGDIYYVPIYIDVDYYQYVDVLVRTNRTRTTNASSTAGGVIYINESPTGSNISSFSPDEVTYLSLASNKTYLGYSGNVGVGTASPSYKLDVNGDGRFTGSVAIITDASSGDSSLILHRYGGVNKVFSGYSAAQALFGGESGIPTRIQAGGQYALTALANGNIGIGTTGPSHKLHVYGADIRQIIQSSADSSYILMGQWDGSTNRIESSVRKLFLTSYTNGIGFGISGSENMTLNTSGNLGIGTTSPDTILTLEKDISTTAEFGSHGHFSVRGASNTSKRLDLGFNTSTNVGFIQAMINGTSYNNLLLNANGGNVGIGTTSANNKLDVVSATANNGSPFAGCFFSGDDSSAMWRCAINLQHNANTTIAVGSSVGLSFTPLSSTSSTFYGSAAIKAVRPNTTANNQDTDLAFWTRTGASNNTVDTEKVRITGNGSVLIGVNGAYNSSKLLQVKDGLLIGNSFYTFASIDTSGTADLILSSNANPANLGSNSNIIFKLGTSVGGGPEERMRIVSNGNVGIGTTSPSAKLHVSGAYPQLILNNPAAGSGAYILFQDNGTAGGFIGHQNSTNKLQFSSTNAGVAHMTIDSGGNVGIGTTSPDVALYVLRASGDSTATFRAASGGAEINLDATNGYAALKIYSSGTEKWRVGQVGDSTGFQIWQGGTGARVYINSSGNVGIGTTNPTQKLEVSGTVLASAFSGPLTGNVTGNVTGSSGSCTGNASTASTADSLNQNNNYTVSGFRANGTIYSGSANNSYGGFQLNSDSHGLRRQDQTNDVYCYTTSGTLYLGAGGSSTTHIRVLSGGDVGIGISPSYKLDVNGNIHATGFPTSSDIRFKKNITPLENSLEKIKKLQGVKYEWNEFVNSVRDGYKLNVPIIGLIAQDVEKIVPEVVDLWKLSGDCQDARSIDYPRLTPLLIEAIKEQQIIIENQNQKIENLIARMSALEAKQNL